MNYKEHPWMGVFPATLCAFGDDESIDEEGLRSYIRDLCAVEGLKGLVCNGHTGEIMSLRPQERVEVTRIFAEEVKKSGKSLKVVSGVAAEGSLEAVDDALAAKEAGADAILLMPPHNWLRFGRSSQTAVGFFEDVAEGADIDIIVHQYPAWTKAGYTLKEMLEMIKIPHVVCIKMGPRDRALIGFAGFAPELMVKLVHACLDGDLKAAKKAQKTVAPLARLIYNFGEPGCGAHQRMKVAKWLMGTFSSPIFRRPLRPLSKEQIDGIRKGLHAIGLKTIN